ncbi:CHAT domain-containing tetratricopeptide repeat protein [Microcoleus sp. D2_18a_B4]|uniref:CHAT domain-containing tetratricopeptide repeat protein n=1 Tax=Microcoleus sp. D2_18a_B4 TaxID=3055329 RepID=UPI002FD4C0EA
MDESHRQAYLHLIYLLFNCPTEDEATEILNANSELVDDGLVQMMLQVADYLAQQGDENNATWLRNWASHLGEMIANSSAATSLEVYFDFLMEVLQATQDSKGNQQVVYQLLQDNLDKLDDDFASALRDWTTAKLSEVKSEEAQYIAAIIGTFSNWIYEFPLGSVANNLEIAIAGHEVVAIVFTREASPQGWAATQNNLANAYSDRIKGDRAENLEVAISYYQFTLEVHTREALPQDWAMTQHNLGNAYSYRIKENRAENLEVAIGYYQAALEVHTCDGFPQYWAMTQNNLGYAYYERIKGDKSENLEVAINHCQAALSVYAGEAFTQSWAATQNNLANAYYERIKGDKSENLELAIGYYQAALSVYKCDAFPNKWALIQHNLANAYRDRIIGDKAENLEATIGYCQAALSVYNRDAFPQNWALTHNNLGIAYLYRITGDKAGNLEVAIGYCQAVLSVFNREVFPLDWAMTQHNLAAAYFNRITGDKAENLEVAIRYYQAALEVYTRDALPQDYTETLFNLGLAYQQINQQPLAYDAFATAIETVEFLRSEIVSGDESKQKLAEEWNKSYQSLVEVCLEMGNYTAAIEYAERSKNRNLVEQILTRDLHNIFPPEAVTELEQLRDEIATNQNKIQTGKTDNPETIALHLVQLRQQRNDLQNRYLPIGYGFNFDHFQATLDDRTAIIEWYITRESFHTFIFTRHSPQPFVLSATIDDRNALVYWANAYIDDYYEQKDNWMTQLTPRLKELAKILHLDEILSHLPKDCQQLILIPHRYLHLFPLHALPVGEVCLLDIFPKGVSYAPSCQLLLQAQKRQRPDFTHLFAVQNPTKDRPYVDFGVEAIRPYFQPNDYVLPGDKAIKASLIQSEQLRSAHCFHFFGHATFNFEKSALILADGHLTLGEIFALDLNQCRLVILSACETGMTDFNSISDEYIGLPSGFLFAGSPSVVSTLWEVDQLSAAFLMIEFYENLRKYKQLEEGDIAIALNLAQKRLRDLTVDEFKKRLIKYKALIDEILSKLPKVERRKAEASITYRRSQAYPFAHPSDWAAFTATGI